MKSQNMLKALLTFCLVISTLCFTAYAQSNANAPVSTPVKKGYVVNAARIFRMDSTYVAMGYSDARHMAYNHNDEVDTIPRPDNRVVMDSVHREMRKDGFVVNGMTLPFSIGNGVFSVEGKVVSPDQVKKYLAIWKNYKPAPIKRINRLATERSTYMMNHIVVQLLKDGMIKDGEVLSFTLNNKEFILNGKKQTPLVYKLYFDEFIKPMPNSTMGWAMK
jgi:hypothetical protein